MDEPATDATPEPEIVPFRPDLHSMAYRQEISAALAHADRAGQARVGRHPDLWTFEAQARQLRLMAFILDELLVAKGEPRAVKLRPVNQGNGRPS